MQAETGNRYGKIRNQQANMISMNMVLFLPSVCRFRATGIIKSQNCYIMKERFGTKKTFRIRPIRTKGLSFILAQSITNVMFTLITNILQATKEDLLHLNLK